MTRVGATEFKARCLELMDRVAERRETYVITKHGRPVARLVPADPPTKRSVFGCMADQMEVVGDVDEPLWGESQWERFERERLAQWDAWEREWKKSGTISGKKTAGRPARRRARAADTRRGGRSAR